MKVSNLAIATLMCCLSTALSSPAIAKGWGKEPTSFIGVQLGAPYTANFSRCDIYNPRLDTPCIYSASNDVYQIWNALSFDFGYTLTMGMYDNAVRSFLLTTKQQNYESLRKILVERYGPPTNSSQQTVQSVGGGKFRSEAASWRGKAVTIELTERAGQVDESAMMIYHNRTQATYSKGKADKASKAASQM